MKQLTYLIIVMLIACNPKTETVDTNQQSDLKAFYIGTYTNGSGKGIYKCTLTSDGQFGELTLAAKTVSPSFLAFSADRQTLLAVNETADSNNMGTVESYKVTSDSLIFLNRSSSGGAHPCHINCNANNDILVANYTGGNIGYLKLKKDGKLSDLLDVQQHTGKGTTSRQEAPHAHSVWFVPNSEQIISVDLGTNELWFSQIDAANQKLQYTDVPKLKMAEGAGPRHLDFHPTEKWLYVLSELSNTITQLHINSNQSVEKLGSVSTLPDDFTGQSAGADIHVSDDGKFVYASNRGHNSLAIFSINQNDGSLQLLGFEPTRGEGPRNFTLTPDGNYVLVANQYTSNIISFKRDKKSGLLTYLSEIEVPNPVCLLF